MSLPNRESRGAGSTEPAAAGPHQAGMTIVEVLAASAVLALMISIVMRVILSGSDAQHYADRTNRVTEITQDVIDDLRRELGSSIRLFESDATGAVYLSMLDLTGVKAALGRRLPAIDATGIFERDVVGAEKTGNSMLFARHAWSTTKTATSTNLYRVDVYRLVHFYLAAEDGGPQAGSATGVNLCKWVSEPLIDGNQIDNIVDPTDQAEVLMHLVNQTADDDGQTHPRAEVVWLKGDDPSVSGSLRHIDDADGSLSNVPLAPRTAPWRFLRAPELSVDGLLHYRHHSIASNFGRASLGVAKFGITDNGAQFPHGAEFQIVGPASARQVLLHLVLVSTNNRGQMAGSAMQVIVASRDL